MIRPWLWVLGRKTTEVESFSSHDVKGEYYQHDLSLLMLNWITWLRSCLSDFSLWSYFFPFFHTVVFGRMSLNRKLYSTFLRVDHMYKLFEILFGGDYLFSLTLFMFLIIYLCQYKLMNIYFILWVIIQYYLISFVAQMKFQLWPLRILPWLLRPFDILHHSIFLSY